MCSMKFFVTLNFARSGDLFSMSPASLKTIFDWSRFVPAV